MTELMVGQRGELTLPADLQERYHMQPETPVRVIETRSGILLIPLTAAPMTAQLAQELQEWRTLSHEALDMFPYEDADA